MAATDLLSSIDTELQTLVDNPERIADYRVGDVQMSRSQVFKMLLQARKEILADLRKEPTEDIRTFRYDVDRFGREVATFIDDED